MYEDLVASGFEVSQNPRNFGMQRGGETWPIWIDGENDGVFDPGDAIYWVAPGYDEADSRTDAFVLSASSRRPLRMRDSVPTASYSVTSVPHVSAFEENALFVAAHRDAERDEPWFWDYLIGGESLTVPVTVEAPVSSETARLHVFMQGFTDNPGSLIDHETHVWLNGAFIGTLTASESGPYHETFEVPTWVLVPGVNDIVFEHAALTALDIAYLDRIELSYTRETRAAEDLIELTLGGPTALHIDGFSGVDVVAITRDEEGRTTWHDTSLMVSSSNGYGIDLEVDHPAVVHAAAISRLLSPTRIRPFHRRPRVTAAPIDLLVFHPKAFTRALKPLLTLRKSQGYRVQAVTLESAYDTWGDGRVSCKAIAASVRACHTRHPDHDLAVLLVGDATYDPKGYAGPQPRQILPTEFVTTSTITVPSDDGYVDFDLDTVPDAAIGRLSVATENELTEVVRKIIGRSYARRGHVALLSDREGEFEWFSSELEREWSLAGPVSTLGGVASTPSEIREDLIAEWGHLPSVVSYSGHGSRITWGLDMILTREDIADLAANGPLPIVVTFNCLSGYFTHPLSPSIGEQFVLEPDAGACAYWGPTALTTTLTQIMLGERFVEELTVPGATLGSAILAAKRALPEAAVETRRTWVLLGDPLTRP